jgi:hypothetical protein
MTRQEHEALVLSEIHNLFEYREGVLYWKARPAHHFASCQSAKIWNGKLSGVPAGSLTSNGYLITSVSFCATPKKYLIHRLIWAIHHGRWPIDQIDHISHNKTDNALSNLREVSATDNGRNKTSLRNNTSGRIGVSWKERCKKWEAYIAVKRKYIYLGRHVNLEDAIKARENAERMYGFHKNHGSQLC